VRVRRNEGVAIRIGLEPCAVIREDVGEASAGERIGQPLSRESEKAWGADGVTLSEGNTAGHVMASVRPTPRGLRPWHVRTLLVREPGGLQLDHSQQRGGPHREGEEP
jgi:hypothetical protein